MKQFAISLFLAVTLYAQEYNARVTYYVDTQTASGITPQEGITIAADKSVKMGQKLLIPALKGINKDGIFTKQDVGPAVEKRIASRGKLPVIDVYVSNKNKIKKYSKIYPSEVLVFEK
jgi:hypothetical protein